MIRTPLNLFTRHIPRTRPSLQLQPSRVTCRIPSTTSRFSTGPVQQARYVRFGDNPNAKQGFAGNRFAWRSKAVIWVGAFCGAYYLFRLERVPETGRLRFMDVSPKLESKMAEYARQALLEEYSNQLLPPNHPLTLHIRRVAERIIEANNLGTLKTPHPNVVMSRPVDDAWFGTGPLEHRTEELHPGVGGQEWELMVVDDDSVMNAMAAYGNIVVFTGILRVARNEEGLAAILGHEMAHTVLRHHSENLSSKKVFIALAALISLLMGDLTGGFFLTNSLYALPNSRTNELEADYIGMKLSSKACYDPRAVPEMMTRLGKASGESGRIPSFMSTHPASSQRVEKLQAALPEAFDIRAANPECAELGSNMDSFMKTIDWGLGRRRAPTVWIFNS